MPRPAPTAALAATLATGCGADRVVGPDRAGGRERQVRSTHRFAQGDEYVGDTSAVTRDFALVDRTVLRPLVRSVEIEPPRS